MSLSIRQSVGQGGVNQQQDVKLIQVLLNTYVAWRSPFTPLKVDGYVGKNTTDAIVRYQREAAGIKNADGRVDPYDKTFRFLTMYISPAQEAVIRQQVREGRMISGAPAIDNKTIDKNAGLKDQIVKYSPSLKADKHIVSEYSIQIIKTALKESGLKTAVITSTIRTPEEQAATMLQNAKKNLKKQYSLYGMTGDAVLKIYEKNKLKSDVLNLMATEIKRLEAEGKRVSQHCVSKEVYLKNNVIDIGLHSMKAANLNFDSKKFAAALKKLKDEGYLEVLIDETMKSNAAWHFEIQVNKKALVTYEQDTILNTTAWI